MKLFISPHNDDAVLFGAFTLQREIPWIRVLTVFDSYIQAARGHAHCDFASRRNEDVRAVSHILGCDIEFLGLRDDGSATESMVASAMGDALFRHQPTEIWIPAVEEMGHPQHNQVGRLAWDVFGGRAIVHRYLTYTNAGKSTWGRPIPCTGAMVRKKLVALAQYETQIENDALGCWPHFLRDQAEYVAV